MSEIRNEPVHKPSVAGRFFGDVFHMPAWQKSLLSIAVVMAVAGAAGKVYSKLSTRPQEQAGTQVQSDTNIATPPPGSSGFVSGSPRAGDAARTGDAATVSTTPLPVNQPTGMDRLSTWVSGAGFAFVAAFIIGWAFRVFIKTMALVTVAFFAILLGLSYFNVVEVDLAAARQKYGTAAGWVTAHAEKLRDLAMAYLPASSSSAVGFFIGLKKK